MLILAVIKLIKIKFYKNGYETFGHANPKTCSQISAMQYIIEGLFLELDYEAGCFDGGDGTGYTALCIENELFISLFEVYKKNFKEWCKSQFRSNEYKIIEEEKELKWDKVLEEMNKRGLSFE